MTKRYWWTDLKSQQFSDIQLLQDLIDQNKFICLDIISDECLILINEYTTISTPNSFRTQDYILTNIRYHYKRYGGVRHGKRYRLFNDDTFLIEVITEEEYNDLLNRF